MFPVNVEPIENESQERQREHELVFVLWEIPVLHLFQLFCIYKFLKITLNLDNGDLCISSSDGHYVKVVSSCWSCIVRMYVWANFSIYYTFSLCIHDSQNCRRRMKIVALYLRDTYRRCLKSCRNTTSQEKFNRTLTFYGHFSNSNAAVQNNTLPV